MRKCILVTKLLKPLIGRKFLGKFEGINNQLYKSSHKALFISGAIMPSMIFIGNLAYVMVCVVGGILVTKRFITIGDIQLLSNMLDNLPSLFPKLLIFQILYNPP